MFIQTETTPNPATVKFIPGQSILAQGTIEFSDVGQAEQSPLAQRLFSLQGVTRVFLAKDFVSVSKADDTDWSMLKPMVLAALMEHLSMGQPIILESKSEIVNLDLDDCKDEISKQIEVLLNERVRPMVAMDGGDIVFDRFEDGIVYLQMKGACSGCPSSAATLKMGVENMLKHYVPEVIEVRPVSDNQG
ncbi:MAG: NifU family protein [Alphaproteobacteria bacterium]|nr:NifU family protein [Alphaproteobacteria bacterium]